MIDHSTISSERDCAKRHTLKLAHNEIQIGKSLPTFELIVEGTPYREWCVPAELIRIRDSRALLRHYGPTSASRLIETEPRSGFLLMGAKKSRRHLPSGLELGAFFGPQRGT
jgi:hypothetical protein